MTTEKEKALELAISQIEKRFGKGSVMKLGEGMPHAAGGSYSYRFAGIGPGFGGGWYSPGTGYRNIRSGILREDHVRATHNCRSTAKGWYGCLYRCGACIGPYLCRQLWGKGRRTVLISQPDTGEQALEITEALVRSGAVDVIVVDSVAALVPRAEIEG